MLSGSTIDTFEARAERVTLNQAISVVSNLLGKDLYISSNRPLPIAMFPVTSRTGHEGLFISVVGKNTTWLNVSY